MSTNRATGRATGIRYTIASLAIAVALLAVSGRAEANAFTISLQTGGVFVPDESYDTLTDSNWINEITVGAGYEIIDGLTLSGVFYLNSHSDTVFETIEQDYSLMGGAIEGQYAYTLFDGLDVYGKLGFGLYFGDYDLTIDEEEFEATDNFVPGGYVSAGVEAYLPHSWLHSEGIGNEDFTVGITFELGYSLAPELHFENLQRNEEPGDDAIARAPIDIGTMAFAGFFMRGGLVVHF